VSAQQYEQKLEDNLASLLERIHTGRNRPTSDVA
jgi:plasmid stabilization system protein ParE